MLHEVVGTETSVRAGASAGEGSRAADEERSVTDTEADEMEEHLGGLGTSSSSPAHSPVTMRGFMAADSVPGDTSAKASGLGCDFD